MRGNRAGLATSLKENEAETVGRRFTRYTRVKESVDRLVDPSVTLGCAAV
jgi:hypothetical protein